LAIGVLLLGCTPGPDPQGPGPVMAPPPTAEPQAPQAAKPELASYGLEHVGFGLPGDDVCEKNDDGSLKNPIEAGRYRGILRNARCDQQKFITMAYLAQQLGVKCAHCHAPHPTDPKKEDYPVMTDNKRTANWMYKTFVQGLRPTDGGKVMCKGCHVDRKTKQPVTKILGSPRDNGFAQEWMHEVMTVNFAEASGKRLRCKTCHLGMAPSMDGWIEDVIRRVRYDGELKRRDDVAGDAGE
jgi:hypothetical protein